MIQRLIKLSKTILSDARKSIIGIILAALVAGTGGVLYLPKTLLHASIDMLKSQIPLWATILLVLLVSLYTYVRTARSRPQYPLIKYIETGSVKWKAIIYDKTQFEVDQCPYCMTHDLKFVLLGDNCRCPSPQCDNRISSNIAIYEAFKNMVEKELRSSRILL